MQPILKLNLILITAFSLCPTISSAKNDPDNIATSSGYIETLEDVEALSLFILLQHHYYDSYDKHLEKLQHEPTEDSKYANKSLDETTLHEFLDDMKHGKLTKSSEDLDCSQADVMFGNYLGKSKNEMDLLTQFQKNKLRVLCDATSKCQSPEGLINLVEPQKENVYNKKATTLRLSQAIVRLCPLILFQLQDNTCTEKREISVKEKSRPNSGAVWGFGILFVTIISFCSLVGVAIMPFLNKSSYLNVLNLFEGIAFGSLVGSSIFHLIPQAFELLGQDSTHDYLWKALVIFAGIYLFFWSERIMKIMVEFRRKKKLSEIPLPSITITDLPPKPTDKHVCFIDADQTNLQTVASNGYSSLPNGDAKPQVSPSSSAEKIFLESNNSVVNEQALVNNNDTSKDVKIIPSQIQSRERSRSNSFTIRHNHNHTHHHEQLGPNGSPIATVAWMIIFGDGLHNFIDGLSIGAAFSQSILSGISISVAVVCEEFPHELGDFAILIASGMTMRQAIGYNFLSACTCYLGLCFGILLGDLTQGSTYVFALAGGMFLYIALVDIMGELSTALDEASQVSMSQTIKVLLFQNVGILLGVSTLFLLAKYSQHINFEGLAPPDQSENPLIGNS